MWNYKEIISTAKTGYKIFIRLRKFSYFFHIPSVSKAFRREFKIDTEGFLCIKKCDPIGYIDITKNLLKNCSQKLCGTTDFDLDELFALHMNNPEIRGWIEDVNIFSKKNDVYRLFILNPERLYYYSLVKKLYGEVISQLPKEYAEEKFIDASSIEEEKILKVLETANKEVKEKIFGRTHFKVVDDAYGKSIVQASKSEIEMDKINKNKKNNFIYKLIIGYDWFNKRYLIQEGNIHYGLFFDKFPDRLLEINGSNFDFSEVVRGEYIIFGDSVVQFKKDRIYIFEGDVVSVYSSTFSENMWKRFDLVRTKLAHLESWAISATEEN